MWRALLLCGCCLTAAPVKVLIVTGQSDTQYHDWRVTTPFVEKVLDAAGRFEVRVVEEPRGLSDAALSGYDTVILNYNGPRWGVVAEAALERFVASGKGLVSFHNVTYGPLMGTVLRQGGGWNVVEGWKAYPDLIGAWWAPENIGHAPRHAFEVKTGDHPITRGMAPSFTVNDELYHKFSLRPGVHVIATAFDDPARGGAGGNEPIAWTTSFGKGRTVHVSLGHDTSALYEPSVMALLARATEWTATGEVSLPPTLSLEPTPKDAVRVLVVTGGHSYDPSFYTVFESMRGVRWSHATSQREAFGKNMKTRFDVVVLYDMYNDIGEAERANLRDFVEAGKGVVALHHSIVDYTAWPWWHEEVIGGKYYEKPLGEHAASRYKDDVPMVVKPAKGKAAHPIVRGLGEIVTVDECYRNMWHSPKITVLMETENELNDSPVVYLGPNPNFRAVYIQLGHGSETHRHPGYRRLVENAIRWAAAK